MSLCIFFVLSFQHKKRYQKTKVANCNQIIHAHNSKIVILCSPLLLFSIFSFIIRHCASSFLISFFKQRENRDLHNGFKGFCHRMCTLFQFALYRSASYVAIVVISGAKSSNQNFCNVVFRCFIRQQQVIIDVVGRERGRSIALRFSPQLNFLLIPQQTLNKLREENDEIKKTKEKCIEANCCNQHILPCVSQRQIIHVVAFSPNCFSPFCRDDRKVCFLFDFVSL